MYEDPPIRCFLSYAQKDDTVMRFVRPFKTTLEALALSDRGRRLEIFHDRESIEWGALAQREIRASVRSALVLLPIITRLYFDRPYCREELLTFHNQAEAEGVPSLLLPVVLLGESHLTEHNNDPAVRIIVERQQRKLREVWIEGPDSPIWRRTLLELTNELIDAVERAEQALAAPQPVSRPDSTEAIAAVEEFSERTTRLVVEARSVVDLFRDHLSAAGPELDKLRDGSARLYELARDYEQRAIRLDRMLRGDPVLARQLVPDSFDLGDFRTVLERLVAQTRREEIMSVPLRQVMHRFRDGLIFIQSAARIVSSWGNLTN